MKLTGNTELFRQELIRQLYEFPGDERYILLFRLSEISALTIYAHCIFIYTDNKTKEVKLLKREWDSKDLSFVFSPGIYQPEKLKFNDSHRVLKNGDVFKEMSAAEINAPLKPEGIIIDGTHYSLRITNGQRASEKYWQLPHQLTGTLKEIVEEIYQQA